MDATRFCCMKASPVRRLGGRAEEPDAREDRGRGGVECSQAQTGARERRREAGAACTGA